MDAEDDEDRQLLMGVLDGLRVIDLSNSRVGAQASQVLADFGADVVWVEPPGGSPLREQPAFPFWGRGKRSIELDLGSREGVAAVLDLAAGADVLIESCRPGVMERLGLGFEQLRERNPRLVYSSITGFGRLGPYAGAKGYEGLVMAKLGGLAAFHKMSSGDHPPFVSVPWCSFAATQLALHGVLAALLDRERSGLGQRVEANLAQGFAALDTWGWFLDLVTERYPDAYTPVEAFDQAGVPASPLVFLLLVALTKDGRWLQFAQVGLHLFVALMKALGLEWMLDHPDWQGIPLFDDKERRIALWEKMLEAAGTKTLAEWETLFEGDPDLFAELFRVGPEVLSHPQLVHDLQVIELVDPVRGRVRQPGPLVQCEATPAVIERSAPALGATDGFAWSTPAEEPQPVPAAADVPGPLPLEGVTVVELAVLFAAPYGATLLTDLGARVIKVEPLDGDPIRLIMPFPETGGAKAMQGKDSICVDITTPEGRGVVHELVRTADVVLQGFRAGVAERHGLDVATLRALNPDLVYLSAPGYGTGPPDGNRPAFAPSIGAASGIARANEGGSVPEHAGLSMEEIRDGAIRLFGAATNVQLQADGIAALGVATGLLLGLLARERGAGGQAMVSSMLAIGAHAMADHVVDFEGNPGPATPDADLRGLCALYRVYDALDGWVFLAAPAGHEWQPLVEALAPYVDLAGVDRFATTESRLRHDAELVDVLAATFSTRGKDDWEQDLLAADVGCVAVSTTVIERVLKSDEIGRASGYLADVEHPTFDQHSRLAPLVRFSRSATQAKPGVLAGSSTDAVLTELGYSDTQIEDLRDRKIVG